MAFASRFGRKVIVSDSTLNSHYLIGRNLGQSIFGKSSLTLSQPKRSNQPWL
jgi:hypothetical protein